MRFVVALALAFLAAGPLAAQELDIREANLPRDYERRFLRLYAPGAATTYEASARIDAGERVSGDVAARSGPLRVDGRVEGDVAMLGGDVVVGVGGFVSGDVMVVGGEVRVEVGGSVGGDIVEFSDASPGRRYAERRERGGDDRVGEDRRRRRSDSDGFATMALRTGPSYNRVEGLGLLFGPVVRTRGDHPLRVEALGIWRTAAETSPGTDPWGYRVEATQFLDRDETVRLGGSGFSVVDPINRWQLRDAEASIAAVGFHQDLRDHFGREGWSVFSGIRPASRVDLEVGYQEERFHSLGAADPWTLFNRSHSWRVQPLVGEGNLRSLTGSLELDFRDDRKDPFEGWYARADVRQGLGGELIRPDLLAIAPEAGPLPPAMPLPEDLPPEQLAADFTTAFVDFRRYMPVTSESQLNVRVMGGGNVDETPLPPQFQHALGGPGSLPGFSPFLADCGARTGVGSRNGVAFYPGFGCDRFLLGQVEFRGKLSLNLGFGRPGHDEDGSRRDGRTGDPERWHHDIEFSPRWMVFLDAGQGWSYDVGGESIGSNGGVTTGRLYDAGAGFLLDDLGVYLAVPLNDGLEREPRFFVRLQRRF